MSLLKQLFFFSISKGIITRLIFWGVIVIINATFSFIISIERFDKIGTIAGVLTWIVLYVIFGSRIYQYLGEKNYKKLQISLFFALIIKSVYSLVSILLVILWDFYHFSFSGDFVYLLVSLDMIAGFGSIYILDTYLLDGWILSFMMALIHGSIITLFTVILGLFIYPFTRRNLFRDTV